MFDRIDRSHGDLASLDCSFVLRTSTHAASARLRFRRRRERPHPWGFLPRHRDLVAMKTMATTIVVLDRGPRERGQLVGC
jgi:hypothetical protein